MASSQNVAHLERSSSGNLSESSSNSGCPTGLTVPTARGVRTASSPAILELCRDESRCHEEVSHLRSHLTRSCPQNVSESAPLTTNTESSEHAESDPSSHEGSIAPQRSTCWNRFVDCYGDTMVKVRNSEFIHVFQTLLLAIPISALAMGLVYADKCPEFRHLPLYGAVMGMVGILFLVLYIAMTCVLQRGRPCFDQQKFIVGFVFLTLLLLVAIEMSLVSIMTPSFSKSDSNYCDVTFYHYVIIKQIATAGALVLAMAIYLPRSRHYFCCNECTRSTPPPGAIIYRSL